MTTTTFRKIENAFQPAKDVQDATRFAGRKEAIMTIQSGLMSEGTNIAIFGNRGIGKTSLARQVINISQGKNDLLKKLGISFDEELDFFPIYLSCGGNVKSLQSLLLTLLASNNGLREWIYDVPKAKRHMESLSPKFGISVPGVVDIGLSGKKQTEVTSESVLKDEDVETVFSNVVNAIADAGLAKDGILIVLDEFDRIDKIDGFATFLKSLSTNCPKVKLCIVGVAQNMQELIREHGSADRLFASAIIHLPPMSNPELNEIIRIAEDQIDGAIRFNRDATERVISIAKGHPYMVHLVGKFALKKCFIEEVNIVTDTAVDEALNEMANRKADPLLEERYLKAVAHSAQRETVLRALARKMVGEEVHTTVAYKLAIDEGVDNPSLYVGQLVTENYGEEIVKVRERYYRFKDSLFVAYILARPRQFTPTETE